MLRNYNNLVVDLVSFLHKSSSFLLNSSEQLNRNDRGAITVNERTTFHSRKSGRLPIKVSRDRIRVLFMFPGRWVPGDKVPGGTRYPTSAILWESLAMNETPRNGNI